jgi:hypothetical protein
MQLTYQQWISTKTAEFIEELGAMTWVSCRRYRGNAPRICAIARLRRNSSRVLGRREKAANFPAIRSAIERDRGRLKPARKSTA